MKLPNEIEKLRDEQISVEANGVYRGAYHLGFNAGFATFRDCKMQDEVLTALTRMPDIMYLELLETTAWMGIPENKRKACIQEQTDNIRFIVAEVLDKYRKWVKTDAV